MVQLTRIFLLMGRFLQEARHLKAFKGHTQVTEAPAGSIVAIAISSVEGSELGVERCLTLCEEADGPCFETPYSSQAPFKALSTLL